MPSAWWPPRTGVGVVVVVHGLTSHFNRAPGPTGKATASSNR